MTTQIIQLEHRRGKMAGKGRGSTKIKAVRTPEQQVTRLKRQLLPEGQARHEGFTMVDVQNHTDDDQRRMNRSQERKTIRRKSKLDCLFDAGVLNAEERKVCEWYHEAYELGYQTRVKTADWARAGGGGSDAVMTHLAKYKAQQNAAADYDFARAGIKPALLPLFERVVLHGHPMGRLKITFRGVVRDLLKHVEHIMPA